MINEVTISVQRYEELREKEKALTKKISNVSVTAFTWHDGRISYSYSGKIKAMEKIRELQQELDYMKTDMRRLKQIAEIKPGAAIEIKKRKMV